MTPTQDRTGKTGSEALARAVLERREELGLTRQELADATGIPYPTIAQIETAYRGVSPARLGVIARVLGLDPKELYEMLAADGAVSADRTGPSAPPTAAPTAAGAPWLTNPRFGAARPAPAAPAPNVSAVRHGARARQPEPPGSRTPQVVDEVVRLLAGLSVDQRLSALGEVQRRILEQTVEERLARGE